MYIADLQNLLWAYVRYEHVKVIKLVEVMDSENVYKEIENVSFLLKKYFEGNLKVQDRQELARWLRKSKRNREFFLRLQSNKKLKECFELRQSWDIDRDFRELEERLQINFRKQVKLTTIPWVRYVAAVACVLFVVGGFWFMWHSSKEQEKFISAKPGKINAVLTMADGKSLRIGENIKDELVNNNDYQFVVNDSTNRLVYLADKKMSKTIRYHKLEVPRGSEYKLELEDGTEIWLNSESSVLFPEAFSDSSREIEVSGEVFLKVTKDPGRPFIVRAGEYRTEVLGTSFMMRVYPDEQVWFTTLVEGKVKVDYRSSSLVLSPGKKAYTDGNELKETEADLRYELAWMKGKFLFRHDRLENVIRTLSRWFAVDFIFDDQELREYEFTGSIDRDQSLEEVLELFEKMEVVTFIKQRNNILIKKIDKAN